MQGEDLPGVEVVRSGVAGDRAYALVDDETGKVISVKRGPMGSHLRASRVHERRRCVRHAPRR